MLGARLFIDTVGVDVLVFERALVDVVTDLELPDALVSAEVLSVGAWSQAFAVVEEDGAGLELVVKALVPEREEQLAAWLTGCLLLAAFALAAMKASEPSAGAQSRLSHGEELSSGTASVCGARPFDRQLRLGLSFVLINALE